MIFIFFLGRFQIKISRRNLAGMPGLKSNIVAPTIA